MSKQVYIRGQASTLTRWLVETWKAPYLLGELYKVGSVASRSGLEPRIGHEDNQQEFKEGTSWIILMTALDVSPDYTAAGQRADAFQEWMRR